MSRKSAMALLGVIFSCEIYMMRFEADDGLLSCVL